MVEVSDATASPIDFEIGDKTIKLHPLRLKHWGLIERWMRQEMLSSASRVIVEQRDILTEPEKRIIIDEAYKSGKQISILQSFASEAMMQSLSGLRQIISYSVCQNNKLTINDVDDLFGVNFDLMTNAFEKIMDISLPDNDSTDNDSTEVSTTNENPST